MRLLRDPKKLLLIDFYGAILSVFLLGVIFVRFEKYVGIPSETLYLLVLFPTMFAIYDLLSYLQSYYKQSLLLKGIAFLNLTYCCLSIGVAFNHYATLTTLGWIYILIEILIIIILATWELYISRYDSK